MNFQTMRENLKDALIESYKPKIIPSMGCAYCGRKGLPLGLHVLELSINEGEKYPDGFAPMSASRGRVRGSFPICVICAPPCRKCGLPTPTEKTLEFGHARGARNGLGMCEHIQWGLLIVGLIKRAFKIGRFNRK